jgi:hypothetical protein
MADPQLSLTNADYSEPKDYPEELWALPEGRYEIAIGMRKLGESDSAFNGVVGVRRVIVNVHSRRDAGYIFSQFTDLKRKVGKLARLQERLFT